jgi:hypothetical protein
LMTAVDPHLLSEHEQRSAGRPRVEARAPAPSLFFAVAALMELAWLSGIGYFGYWLLS